MFSYRRISDRLYANIQRKVATATASGHAKIKFSMKLKSLFALLLVVVFSFGSGAASRDAVRARNSMVASVNEIVTRTAVDVLQRGNAMDAAVAALFTLAVVWPEAGNLGGGTFFLIRNSDGKTEFIDAREIAPKAATRDMYQKGKSNASTVGHLAVAVPGAVAGMAMALERHGSLKWNELIEPARKFASNGFRVSLKTAQRMKKNEKQLTSFSETSKIFLRNGKFLNEDDVLVQPDLAATLKRLQEKGSREFYEGETANLIVQEMKKNGGLITAEDLRDYKPVIRKPLSADYKGYTLLTAPPPSSGGIALIQILKMLENHDLKTAGIPFFG